MERTAILPIPIRTKFHRPRSTDDIVERPRLTAKLDSGVARELTLVSAPAGFGKTTLISRWLESCNSASAWLTLDVGDGDLATFLLYVVTAIQNALSATCVQTQELLRMEPLPPVDTLFASFVNELALLPQPLILAIDDYDRIRDEAVSQFMARLIDAQPPQLHLVLIVRIDPLLPLPRFRVRQQMTEIRARDLRFSADEAEQFLRIATNCADQKLATSLHQRTEGWPAGMRLAVLSIGDVSDPTAMESALQGGANRYVTEYLAAEVLAHQSQPVQNFLLQTAILDQFCADLCAAVTAQPPDHCRKILDELVSANIFLVELDEEDGWYRYHHLFQDMLKGMMAGRVGPKDVEALHRRAGAWFIRENYVEMALRHALAVDDMGWAAETVEEHSRNALNRVERYRLERWLGLLDEDVAWQRPRLVMAKALQLYRQYRITALDDLLDRAEEAMAQNHYKFERDEAVAFRGVLQSFRSCTAYLVHRDDRSALAVAEDALQWLPVDDRTGSGIALGFSSLALQGLGEKESAIARLNQAVDDPSHFGPAKPQALLGLAFIHFFSVDLALMSRTAERFRALATDCQQANVIGGAYYVSGFLAYELNDLAAATDYFATVTAVRTGTNLVAASSCMLGLARIHHINGDLDTAARIIDEVRSELVRVQSTDILAQVDAVQALHWCLAGEPTQALRWARTFDTQRSFAQHFCFLQPTLARASILITHGTDSELHTLRTALSDEVAQADARHNRLHMVRTLAQLALLEARLGRQHCALEVLTRAVNVGRSGGLIRSFVDCGLEMGALIEQLARKGAAPHYLSQLLSASTVSLASNGSAPSLMAFAPQYEPLTRREFEVLDLLQQGMTNQEIADQLVISLHTAKRHVSNMYSKLDVDNRKQVILRARQLGLV